MNLQRLRARTSHHTRGRGPRTLDTRRAIPNHPRDMSNRFRVVLPLAVVICLSAVTLAQQSSAGGRALTIEDYYRIRNVGSPSISPNGRWVAFTVTTRVEDEKNANRTASEGWYVPIDGAARPAQIATGQG